MSTQPIVIRPKRQLGPMAADVVIEERHQDTVTITEHPVEQGSTIADHIYRNPARLSLVYVWDPTGPQNAAKSITFLKDTYNKLLTIQSSATLLDVFTGKRVYKNMTILSVEETTEEATENVLRVRLDLQEIMIATTQTVQVADQTVQSQPDKTTGVLNQGFVNLGPGDGFNGTGVPPA